ncbi:NADH dehydrogenase [ubiquinone] 1 beta subcomplex subunit 8, mitochondrial [Frankliniella fusca]|uniref:NADH dehydrogenase [ubiquinone] 1 beta subcomplex subunit 8, mitochondrial n=1 Tax=Frankliniella fusca TaxID=407009 RepID=A0AAE1H256_9NEOP|nr:NADH dehydrogenase [ubiquinone] 1 beta subcomplex subunit 8, mitochondrial [Frankliniella fusca]
MALLRQLLRQRGLAMQPALLYNSSRTAVRVLADYMPGPYPKTEKERLAAAKKYGLLPEEYKPLPDDGWGRGDYPDLPMRGADSRDDYYPWDMPEYKKNYGEVWHVESEILGEDRLDPAKDWWYSRKGMIGMLVGTMTVLGIIAVVTDPYRLHRPVSVKAIPGKTPDKVFYSFERGLELPPLYSVQTDGN